MTLNISGPALSGMHKLPPSVAYLNPETIPAHHATLFASPKLGRVLSSIALQCGSWLVISLSTALAAVIASAIKAPQMIALMPASLNFGTL